MEIEEDWLEDSPALQEVLAWIDRTFDYDADYEGVPT